MRGLILVTLLLFLAGCGGGGGNGDDEVEMPDDVPVPLVSDDRVKRLETIVERTDSLLTPGVHVQYSVAIPGQEATRDLFQGISCTGDTCTHMGVRLDLNTALLTGLIDPNLDLSVSEANLRSRADGFDTAFISGSLDNVDIGGLIPDITIDEIPEATAYGLWGDHGMAGLILADGRFSARASGIPFTGDMQAAVPFAFGDVSGSNPGGSGSATWTGVAEAVALRTFMRREGVATLTMRNLAMPVVSVGIDLAGNPIGKPSWSDVEITDGGFIVGVPDDDDYLQGNFHGPDHQEAYGVFDTDNFTGSFGAIRQN